MDDNILAAVGCVIAVHHNKYLHQLLLLVTPFLAKEDTIMTTHIRSKRLGKSSLKEEIFVFPTHRDSRTPPHTLRNSSTLGLFRPNLEEISLVFSVFLALVITRTQNHTSGHKSPLTPLIKAIFIYQAMTLTKDSVLWNGLPQSDNIASPTFGEKIRNTLNLSLNLHLSNMSDLILGQFKNALSHCNIEFKSTLGTEK
jgi:hypothetical protein